MLWCQEEYLTKLVELAAVPVKNSPSTVLINGAVGMGKSELVNQFIAHLPENCLLIDRLNFDREVFSIPDFSNEVFRETLFNEKAPRSAFWANFTPCLKRYIRKGISEKESGAGENKSWLEDVVLQYLTFLGEGKTLVFIFENIHQIDRAHFERVNNFFGEISHLPVLAIYTGDPEGTFHHRANNWEIISLSRLSIRQTEQQIGTYFRTSALNARLIANHCYLKTAGNPLQIRFLLEAVYRPLIESGNGEFINVREMQKIKIFGSWDHIFYKFFTAQSKQGQNFLALLAYLDAPVLERDFHLMLKELKLPFDFIPTWVKCGALLEIAKKNQVWYALSPRQWQDWLRKTVPIEKMKEPLLILAELTLRNQFIYTYRLSNLLDEIGKSDIAISLAQPEANALYGEGKLTAAADRLYFLVRISHLNPDRVPFLEQVFQKLGDVYLQMGAYDNAFEILRQLRDFYNRKSQNAGDFSKSKWLDVNIKMIRALIAMDAIQEARYIIRETIVKKFCDAKARGLCKEMSGDIELNLAHTNYAISHYREALEQYRKTGANEHILSVYHKLKPLLTDRTGEYEKLLTDTKQAISVQQEADPYKCYLLRDEIRMLLEKKQYDAALTACYQLRRLLRKVYHPVLFLQLVFYFGDIYTRLGKWRLAVSQLEKIADSLHVKHRPLWQIQVDIHLGVMYKEQALYGDARAILEKGLELAHRHHFLKEVYEIKLHLGHLYLLVHAHFRAKEFLIETHDWGQQNRQHDVLLLARLYLFYYEILYGRLEKARIWLREAKSLVNLSGNPVDFLNYLYYLTLWMIEMNKLEGAEQVVNLLFKKAGQIPRYRAAGHYLLANHRMANKDYNDAESELKKALTITKKWQLPQIQYLVHCLFVRVAYRVGKEQKFKYRLSQALKNIYSIAENIKDEILRVQFLEARYHERILQWAKEYKVKPEGGG